MTFFSIVHLTSNDKDNQSNYQCYLLSLQKKIFLLKVIRKPGSLIYRRLHELPPIQSYSQQLPYNLSIQMEEDQLEFEVHRAQPRPDNKTTQAPFLGACKQLEDELVQQQLTRAVDDLLSVCQTEYANGVQGQIFPVQLLKNQQQQLQKFLMLLESDLSQRKDEIFPLKSRMREEAYENEQRVKVVFLQGSEIRDLVLQMYIYLQEHPAHEVVVFIAKDITDLKEQNLYCFEKALKNKRFISVMSTFATFEGDVESLSHTHYEKYHISLYNPKELFCQFVYQCMAKPSIKAYLPEGVIRLITDMDYYSLSFRESCRRFCFCFERALMMVHRERIWVDFDGLITLIEEIISKKFRLYCGYKNSLQKIIKVILSEKQSYTISQKAVSLEVAMGAHLTPAIEENDIMNSIRESLFKHLSSKPQYQPYTNYLLQNEDIPQQSLRRKKSRFDQLGIDTKKNITPKNKLQNQLTRIIKQATLSIRQQAAAVNWDNIKYELRIRPQIPNLIVNALKASEETKDLVEEILSEYISPISKYFLEYEKSQYGKLIYTLKSLELSGMIDLTKKQQKQSVCLNHFDKANFAGKFA